jgi:hypothetical protein
LRGVSCKAPGFCQVRTVPVPESRASRTRRARQALVMPNWAVKRTTARAAVHGAVSMRVNQPDLPWPPLGEQVDRFVAKLLLVRMP